MTATKTTAIIELLAITTNYKKGIVNTMKNNVEIRQRAKEKGVLLWEVAEELNICDSSFSRKLRKELPTEEKSQILDIIENLAKEKDCC